MGKTVASPDEQATDIAPPDVVSGTAFQRGIAASLEWLEANSARIDRLNVFPVPDGDTGTNMVLTLRAAVEQVSRLESPTVAEVGQAMARGSLLGARGNSGVILSQILRGMSEGLAKFAQCGPSEFARGIEQASRAADEAVTNPVEGTILTVARDAAKAAVANAKTNLEDLGTSVVEAARTSVKRTPEQLAVLKEAGVVDAGGQGLLVIYEGLLRNLRGLPPPEILTEDRGLETFSEFAVAHGADEHGYCTEFVILGTDMDPDVVRETMGEFGGSLLVVGDPSLIRVHMHTETPGEALTAAMTYGPLDAVKAENMDMQQAESFSVAATEAATAKVARVPVVATATGEGLTQVFESLGATVVAGGASMNPSAGDILEAVEGLDGDWAVVLPNNKNIVMAARQAAEQSDKDVRVIGTRTVPEGVAALVAFNATAAVEVNQRMMQTAAGDITTLEITQAVRDATIGGLAIKQGDYLGLQDDDLVTTGEAPNALVKSLLEGLADDEPELATIYYGSQVASETVEQLTDDLEATFPDLEVEVISGGQELYDYVISVE